MGLLDNERRGQEMFFSRQCGNGFNIKMIFTNCVALLSDLTMLVLFFISRLLEWNRTYYILILIYICIASDSFFQCKRKSSHHHNYSHDECYWWHVEHHIFSDWKLQIDPILSILIFLVPVGQFACWIFQFRHLPQIFPIAIFWFQLSNHCNQCHLTLKKGYLSSCHLQRHKKF